MLDKSFVNTSVSWGTLRQEDLIPAFHNFLHEVGHTGVQYSGLLTSLVRRGITFYSAKLVERADWTLEDLFDKLDSIAPEGTSFGAHPGDGSDFGFFADDQYDIEDD